MVTPLHGMQGLPSALVKGAYPESNSMPDYITSNDFYKFTPTRDYLALPGRCLRVLEPWVQCCCADDGLAAAGMGAHGPRMGLGSRNGSRSLSLQRNHQPARA